MTLTMIRQLTDKEWIDKFGTINCSPSGILSPKWQRANLVYIRLPTSLPCYGGKATKINCNIRVADSIRRIFEEIHAAGLWPQITNYGGCFNYRLMRGSSNRLSRHSWGAAIDLNDDYNKLGAEGAKAGEPGYLGDIAAIFAKYKWVQLTHDKMHFEFGAEG